MALSSENLLYHALRIRMVEEKIIELYPSDVIQSPVHLSIGQEHHTVAFISLLGQSDRVFTTYRSHAVYLAKGGDLKQMFAELYGKSTGVSGGKAGSMHLCFPECGMMGSSAIVGAVFSHAMGAAYADKIVNSGNLVACITGEGATEEGTFHECLNFTALKQVPLIYVVENNGLAINIPLEARQSYRLRDLAGAYGIHYLHIADSFDQEEVIRLAAPVVAAARATHTPALIEIDTYRYKEHVGICCDHDKSHRDPEKFQRWCRRDPLICDLALLEKYQGRIAAEIDEAVRFAEESSFPGRDELLKDVF